MLKKLVAAGITAATLLAVVSSAGGALGPGERAQAAGDVIPGRYIVVVKDGATPGATAARHGLHPQFVYEHALRGFAGAFSGSEVAAIRADRDVVSIQPDRAVHADGQPVASGETIPTGVRRVEAATGTTAHGASIVNVAVIDTGIDLGHPDLNAVSGTNCINPGTPAQDDNGHGTHVTGTIAAKNQGSGVVGMAPGTTVYAVKVLNSSGSGTFSEVICGINWVTANSSALNIKVANMSLGGSGSNDNNCGKTNNDAMHQAICNSTAAGIIYVVAAGNSASGFSSQVPAAYPEVLTVTAMSDSDGSPGGVGGAPGCRTGELDDSYATFSSFASASDTTQSSHTIAGPGVCIVSTWLNGAYNTISGTSMATPHVAGTVALCIGSGGVSGPCLGLTPSAIIQRVRSDAAAHATSANGFTGDPNSPLAPKPVGKSGKSRTSPYYGYLVWDGNY